MWSSVQIDRLIQRLAVVQEVSEPKPTMHTDGVGRVEARQWKHYSKGYEPRQREVCKQVPSVLRY